LLAMIGAGAFLWRERLANTELQSDNRQLRADNARLTQPALPMADQAKSAYLGRLENHVHARRLEANKNSRSNGASTGTRPFHNAGQMTPRAASQTFAWASDQGNTDALAKLIYFDGDGRSKATAILATLPEAVRAEYPTPEALYALFIADDALTHPPPPDDIANTASENYLTPDRVKYTFPAGGGGLQFQNTPDGWKYVIPAGVVQHFATQILVDPPAGSPAPTGN